MILVTGAAGFIGYHVAEALLQRGDAVLGIDNLNDYYDVRLKESRLERLRRWDGFTFKRLDITDAAGLGELFRRCAITEIVHLAAQAGVRYSLVNPHAYLASNLAGWLNVLENARLHGVRHLVYASSSSVYGANAALPSSVHQPAGHPLSLYAATKRAGELIAHSYAYNFALPCTGLRFFTVYGPWGRPDMAVFLFTRAILEGKPICLFNQGDMSRSFTYIDDVVAGVLLVLAAPPKLRLDWDRQRPHPATSSAPWRLYDLGNPHSVSLTRLIDVLESALGKPAVKVYDSLQPGDVPDTAADISDLESAFGFRLRVSLDEGIPRFVRWFREYYCL